MDKERADRYSDEEYKEVLVEEWWRDQAARVEYEWLMHLNRGESMKWGLK